MIRADVKLSFCQMLRTIAIFCFVVFSLIIFTMNETVCLNKSTLDYNENCEFHIRTILPKNCNFWTGLGLKTDLSSFPFTLHVSILIKDSVFCAANVFA